MNEPIMKIFSSVACFLCGIWLGWALNKTQIEQVEVEKRVEVPVEVIKEVEVPVTEYVRVEVPKIIEKEIPVERVKNTQSIQWIDPDSIPITYPAAYVRGMTTYQHLTRDHGVHPQQIRGWSEPDMTKLHTYLHNGGKL